MLIVDLHNRVIYNRELGSQFKEIASKKVGIWPFRKEHPIVDPGACCKLIMSLQPGQKKPTEIIIPPHPYDLSSKPWWSWAIVGKPGTHPIASRIHDFLYSSQLLGRAVADLVFLRILQLTEADKSIGNIMYFAVDKFGRSHYKNSDERDFMIEYICRSGLEDEYIRLLREDIVAFYPEGGFDVFRDPELKAMPFMKFNAEYVNYLKTGKSEYI